MEILHDLEKVYKKKIIHQHIYKYIYVCVIPISHWTFYFVESYISSNW